VVRCHCCYAIVHPGHLKYLQFAHQQGDVLVVSLSGDDAIEKSDGTRPYMPQELRAESLAALEFVDHVVVSETATAEPIVRAVRPDVYIKGKDYERSTRPGFLAEKALVESLGGRVIFSSGDVIFSLSAILDDLGAALEADGLGPASPGRLAACCVRWGLSSKSLQETIGTDFANKTVAVVGDVIADRYIFCEASDVAAEAPILSVRPLKEAEYLGGAAIVAAHLSGLGAQVHLLTTLGSDASSGRLVDPLSCGGAADELAAVGADSHQGAVSRWHTEASQSQSRTRAASRFSDRG
jgi:rfaE bifunctional protein nucleotidyltransferase chain/domain